MILEGNSNETASLAFKADFSDAESNSSIII